MQELKKFLRKLPVLKQIREYLLKRNDRKHLEDLQNRNKSLNQNSIEIMNEIYNLMEPTGIEYFFDYGSLLGFIRERGIISHDCDVDVSCIVDNVSDFAQVAKVIDSRVNKDKFIKMHEIYLENDLVEITYRFKGVTIDFFANVNDGDTCYSYSCYRVKDVEYADYNECTPFKSIKPRVEKVELLDLKDYKVKVPCNAEEVLVNEYGENWRIPNPNWDETTDCENLHRVDTIKARYVYIKK